MTDVDARLLAIMRRHFERLWADREHEHVRLSLRDNIRGQRSLRFYPAAP